MATNILQTNFLQTNVLSTNLPPNPNVLVRSIQPPPAPIATGFVVTTDEVEKEGEKTDVQLYPAIDLLGLGTNQNTQQRHEFYNPEKVKELVDELIRTSAQHAVALKAKQENEQQVLTFS